MNQRTWLFTDPSITTDKISQLLTSTSAIKTSPNQLMQSAAQAITDNDLVIFSVHKIADLWPALQTLVEQVSNSVEASTKSDVQLNMSRMTAAFNQQNSVRLTSREFQILSVIHANAPAATSRDQIIVAVWGDMDIAAKAFDVHLVSLRRKLKPIGIRILYSAPHQYTLKALAKTNTLLASA